MTLVQKPIALFNNTTVSIIPHFAIKVQTLKIMTL
jgi:hypothetical protein